MRADDSLSGAPDGAFAATDKKGKASPTEGKSLQDLKPP